MDKTLLVDRDIELGARFIARLDTAGITIKAALWFYLPDSEQWRLVISTPIYDEKGPKQTYKTIRKVLEEDTDIKRFISLDNISIVSIKDPIIQTFSGFIKTESDAISDMRLTHNRINNTYVEDAFIYRMN